MKLIDFIDREPWLANFVGPAQPKGDHMIDFYRVETANTRKGPYNTQDTYEQNRLAYDLGSCHGRRYADGYRTHPNPFDDPGLRGIRYNEECGFADEFSMRKWFDGWGQRLTDAGYVINVYSVPANTVRVGTTQSVCAGLLDREPVKTLKCVDVLKTDPDMRSAWDDMGDADMDDEDEDSGYGDDL